MTTPSSPLENALVLALEAIERVIRAELPDVAFASADVVDASGPAHTFTIAGIGDGTLGIGVDGDATLTPVLETTAADLATALATDLTAALGQELSVTATGTSVEDVADMGVAVKATLDGLDAPATLWVAVDVALGETIATTVQERLDALEPEPEVATEAVDDPAPEAGESTPPEPVQQPEAVKQPVPQPAEPAQRPPIQPQSAEPVEVLTAEFPQMGAPAIATANHDMSLLSDVQLAITVELGRTTMRVRDLLELGAGSVVELDRSAGTPVDVLVNGTIVARGEVVVVEDELGVRVTEVVRSDAGLPT